MCTILTVSADLYSRGLFHRIHKDALQNGDGFALLLIDAFGAASIVRTMDIGVVTTLLERTGWERMFLHCRYATQGDISLENVHGWSQDGVFYMHNGAIMDSLMTYHNVDSQVIGDWLYKGVTHTLEKLAREDYANVFLIDTVADYYAVNRSKVGTLYTDWKGNYSTHKLGPIRHPVPHYTQQTHWLLGEAPVHKEKVCKSS